MKKKLVQDFLEVRKKTLEILKPLETEDYCVQPAPHVSPPKWHLAHTSWFFEKLILEKHIPDYKCYDKNFHYLFNSYYKALGPHWLRVERGNLSRPTVCEIFKFREHVDSKIVDLINSETPKEFTTDNNDNKDFNNITTNVGNDLNKSSELENLILLGIQHEQQHQELLFMDIKYIFSSQIMDLSYKKSIERSFKERINQENKKFNDTSILIEMIPFEMISFHGGFSEMGVSPEYPDFHYDNESPKHKVWLSPFQASNRLINNQEYLEFIESGGYKNPEYWLSDGWDWLMENKIDSPLYWFKKNDSWYVFTFEGFQKLNLQEPVMHISYYEALAYARYKNKRLLTEAEWEFLARSRTSKNHKHSFLNTEFLSPPIVDKNFEDLEGSLWQWTQSSYLPYPGHKWVKGPLGEYNSKFMVNQMVLRGGCFVTEKNHYRSTYRNFYYPHERWAFTGLRLGGDL